MNVDELVANNIGLVKYIARSFLNTGYEYEELVQEGMVGLVKAAKTFDESRGFLFSTYAGRCIQKEILNYLRRERKQKDVLSLHQTIPGLDDIKWEQVVGYNQEEYEEVWKRDLLKRCVASLDEKEKEILRLYYGEGMKQCDIAERFHWSQPRTCLFIKKTLQKMRKFAERD